MDCGSVVSSGKLGTQPQHDATIAGWEAFKVKGESWLHKKGLLKALKKNTNHLARSDASNHLARSDASNDLARSDATNHLARSDATNDPNNRGVEHGPTRRDETQPDDAEPIWTPKPGDSAAMSELKRQLADVMEETADIIDKIEKGEIDTDSSLISFCPRGFDTPFLEPFSQEKVLELNNNNNNNNSTNVPKMGSINVSEVGLMTGAASDGPGQKKKKQKKTKMTKMMKRRVKMKKDKGKDWKEIEPG